MIYKCITHALKIFFSVKQNFSFAKTKIVSFLCRIRVLYEYMYKYLLLDRGGNPCC